MLAASRANPLITEAPVRSVRGYAVGIVEWTALLETAGVLLKVLQQCQVLFPRRASRDFHGTLQVGQLASACSIRQQLPS